MKIPNILNNKEFLDAPLDYKWDEDSADFYAVDANNKKLGKILDELDYKVVFGIATALCEWVYWRMSKHIDKPKIVTALEAHWAGLIDKHYFYSWKYDAPYASDLINGPTWAMWSSVQFTRYNYIEENHAGVVEDVPRLAMLARHICPDEKFFDDWLNGILKKSAELFPYQEPSIEAAIPRQFFFDSDYDYKTADNNKIINEFLSSLNYKENETLNSPNIMKKEGFVGVPYEYKG